jgi:hypothetical protein
MYDKYVIKYQYLYDLFFLITNKDCIGGAMTMTSAVRRQFHVAGDPGFFGSYAYYILPIPTVLYFTIHTGTVRTIQAFPVTCIIRYYHHYSKTLLYNRYVHQTITS